MEHVSECGYHKRHKTTRDMYVISMDANLSTSEQPCIISVAASTEIKVLNAMLNQNHFRQGFVICSLVLRSPQLNGTSPNQGLVDTSLGQPGSPGASHC